MNAVLAASRPRVGTSSLAGLGLMAGFFLRRNWIRLVVWLAVVVVMMDVVAAYYKSQFNTPTALGERAMLAGSVGMRTVFGTVTSTGLGAAVWSEMWMFTACLLAIGMAFLVTRNNRADEEHGRTELLRSRPIAPCSGLAATVATLTAVCVLAAVGVSVVCGLYKLDPAGTGWTGSWLMGASLGAVGLLGVGLAALTNQLTVTGRDANGLALGVFAVCYLVRAVGDLEGNALIWASPIGWGEKTDPWGHDRWLPLVFVIAVCLGCVAAAFVIQARRDYGAGVMRPRSGPVRAHRFATTEFGLTVLLNRRTAIAWIIGLALWSVLLGSAINDMKDLGAQLAQITGGGGLNSIIALWVRITALLVATLVASQLLSLRGDEEHGLVEPRLAGGVSRWRLAGIRLLFAAILAVVVLVVTGVVMGAVYGHSASDMAWAGRLTVASLAYLPSLGIIAGVALASYGWWPRLAGPMTWTVVGIAWIVMLFGNILKIPTSVLDKLPFTAVDLPATEPATATILITSAIAVILVVVGLIGFRRRGVPQ